MLIWSMALASGVNNPGGEQIPFVKLRSEQWNIVLRLTADTRARLERVVAHCDGTWVDACQDAVSPGLREHALPAVFKSRSGVKLVGDHGHCATVVVLDLPVNLGRDLVDPDPAEFCEAIRDPAFANANATSTGENDLVNRLMGGENTTSGRTRIKPVPRLPGWEPDANDPDGTDASEDAVVAAAVTSTPTPAAPAPVPVAPPAPVAVEVSPTDPASPPSAEPAGVEPSVEPQRSVSSDGAVEEAVVVRLETPPPPPPAPAPSGPDEFALEAAEVEVLERLSDVAGEEAEPKKKKKKKKKAKKRKADGDQQDGKAQQGDAPAGEPASPASPAVVVEGDEDFDAYIVIDIENLPDED